MHKSQFLHIGDVPVQTKAVDTSDALVHPGGLIYPGQVVRAASNPDPVVFRDVTPADPVEGEGEDAAVAESEDVLDRAGLGER